MNKIITYYILLATLFGLQTVIAQTDLEPGDVAVVGLNTSTWGTSSPCTQNQDNFAFVLLVDVEAGTEIYFTDNGVQASDGCLRNNEGKLKWTAPAGGVEKGTIISIYTFADNTCQPEVFDGPGTVTDPGSATSFDLNVSGEQIIIYQDDGVDINCPDEYLFAITNNESWQTDATNSHTSALPPGLTDGENALALPKLGGDFQNNARFDCGLVNSGSKEAIMESLVDPDNWEGAESATYEMPDCAFTFGGVEIVYVTYDQMKLKWPDPKLSGEEVIIVGKAGSPVTVDPSGTDGAGWTVDTDITVAENIGDNTYVLYKGDGSDTTITVTGLTEGNTYYFKTYSHALTSTAWVEGEESIPSYDTAEVQPVTNPGISLNPSNYEVTLDWTTYIGDPKADWWDGGVLFLHQEGSTVTTTQDNMNSQGKSSDDYSLGDNVGTDEVKAIVSGGSPGTVDNTVLSNLTKGITHYFKLFHNDGRVDNDHYWSRGLELSVYLPEPEIKVTGNSLDISNGDNSPSTADHTDFGQVLNDGGSKTNTFKIKNTGDGVLNLSNAPNYVTKSGSNPGRFSITQPLFDTVAPVNGENSFDVIFQTPSGSCDGTTYSATLTIHSEDPDIPSYEFDVQGTCRDNCFSLSSLSGTVGTEITVTGDGFDAGTTFTIDGVNIADKTYVVGSGGTEYILVMPTGLTAGTYTINSTSGSTPNSCNDFTVIAAPGTCY